MNITTYERDNRANQAAVDALIEQRLAVPISADAAESLLYFLGERYDRPYAGQLGWDLRRQDAAMDGLGQDTFNLAVSLFGETPPHCWVPTADGQELRSGPWLNRVWAGFDRPHIPSDRLIIDEMADAMLCGWEAPPDVVAAVEALRDAVEARRAEREAAKEAAFQRRCRVINQLRARVGCRRLKRKDPLQITTDDLNRLPFGDRLQIESLIVNARLAHNYEMRKQLRLPEPAPGEAWKMACEGRLIRVPTNEEMIAALHTPLPKPTDEEMQKFAKDMRDGKIPMPTRPTLVVDNTITIAATPFKWQDPRTIPQREWLYGRSLIRRQLMLTVAHPGVGKSSLSIVEAVALAIGRTLLHEKPHQRCRVWLWNGEDPADELQRRVTATALHYKVAPSDLEGWLFVDSGRDMPIIIAQGHRDGVVIATPVYDAVVATIQANKIDVMVIDPFVSCHAVSENDNNAIDAVAKTYARIANVTGCAIHLVHHSRKTGGEGVDVEHSRGASALLGAVRSARTLNLMTKEEAAKIGVTDQYRYVRIEDGKANLAPRSEIAAWVMMESVYIGNGDGLSQGDSVGVLTRWRWPDPMEGMTADKQAAAMAAVAAGQWRENLQAKEWVGNPVAEAMGLDVTKTADKAKVAGLIKRWLAAGLLVVVTGKDSKGNDRPFVEVGKAKLKPLTPARVDEEALREFAKRNPLTGTN